MSVSFNQFISKVESVYSNENWSSLDKLRTLFEENMVFYTKKSIEYFFQTYIQESHASLNVGRSHFHNNGFEKLSLYKSPIHGFNIRLHIWCGNEIEIPKDTIHNHRWDFISYILCGQISFTNYSVLNNKNNFKEVEYGDTNLDGVKHSLFKRNVGLEISSQYTLKQYDKHMLAKDVAHSAKPKSGILTATLVISSYAEKETTNSYKKNINVEVKKITNQNESYSHEQKVLLINKFISQL